MSIEEQRKVVSPWAETTADVGSAVLGAAVGMVVGDLVKEGARKPVAFVLGCIGIAAIVPAVVDGVKEVVAGPNTRRGARRTLKSIRDAGVSTRDDLVEEDEMFVG
ncbi:hypothetical protein [Roseibacillus ishigakijimensis]|uniref:Uncharacterized protein n=1 Tax=Roseibacillus ishigakijimensis TaxID=454146 RepID=A0A934RWC9_9BACT|nr:hypothetical protein [Roseibacillus ishigakijimensis]MBK1835365.1 hypothetical protein [Roseibacillus ishigakijimensis]